MLFGYNGVYGINGEISLGQIVEFYEATLDKKPRFLPDFLWSTHLSADSYTENAGLAIDKLRERMAASYDESYYSPEGILEGIDSISGISAEVSSGRSYIDIPIIREIYIISFNISISEFLTSSQYKGAGFDYVLEVHAPSRKNLEKVVETLGDITHAEITII